MLALEWSLIFSFTYMLFTFILEILNPAPPNHFFNVKQRLNRMTNFLQNYYQNHCRRLVVKTTN